MKLVIKYDDTSYTEGCGRWLSGSYNWHFHKGTKWCCDKMRKWYKEMLDIKEKNLQFNTYEYCYEMGREYKDTYTVAYCPFCGEKIENIEYVNTPPPELFSDLPIHAGEMYVRVYNEKTGKDECREIKASGYTWNEKTQKWDYWETYREIK